MAKPYLREIGAVSRSMRKAAIVDTAGRYPKTVAVIEFVKDETGAWALSAPDEYMPSEDQEPLILNEVATANWPTSALKRGRVLSEELPEKFRAIDGNNIFEIRSPAAAVGAGDPANMAKEFRHDLIMLLIRVDHDNGKKSYHPLSWFDDGKFRELEPDGYLPIYGAEQIHDDHGKRIAYLHEGPKAAREARGIAEANPRHAWHRELSQGIHLGWLGGAKRYGDTDWKALRHELKRGGIERVVIVGDNDKDGRDALPKISQLLRMTADHLRFPTNWKIGFDMADKFPIEPPPMDACLLPGTFMTVMQELKDGKKTRRVFLLTSAATAEWTYIPDHGIYVATRFPAIQYDQERVNALLRPLSHIRNTAELIQKAAYSSGRPMRLTYDPGKPPGVIADDDGAALNSHRPSKILPKLGDAKPWRGLLVDLFPIEKDRLEVERWCATLIAHPERRMLYGLLLISEVQGVGKSTLGRVLAMIVGVHNASFPSEGDVLSDFNEWVYERRLAVVNEIYAGASWKAYNGLKDIITEPVVTLNRKFQRQIKVPNWVHLVACSNNRRALKIADEDRRWFVPELTELSPPRKNFVALWAWLADGGYGEIVTWAKNYEKYVEAGEHAPGSDAKEAVIAAGWSYAAKLAVRLAHEMTDEARGPAATTVRKLREYVRGASGNDRVNESDDELIRLVKKNGLTKWGRIKIGASPEVVLVNGAARAKLETLPHSERNGAVRELVKAPLPLLPM